MSRRAKILIGIVSGAFALLVAGLPFTLMLVPNPGPQLVTAANASSLPTGVYITTGATTYRIHPYADSQKRFPAGSLVARPYARVSIRYRALDDAELYSLHVFGTGATVASRREIDETSREITLLTESLPPGRYYVTSARDSMYGGTDYVYFEVAEDPRGPAAVK